MRPLFISVCALFLVLVVRDRTLAHLLFRRRRPGAHTSFFNMSSSVPRCYMKCKHASIRACVSLEVIHRGPLASWLRSTPVGKSSSRFGSGLCICSSTRSSLTACALYVVIPRTANADVQMLTKDSLCEKARQIQPGRMFRGAETTK